MKETIYIYTDKRYVLRTIKEQLDELGDFKYFDILVFEHAASKHAEKPETYEELVELLKDCDMVLKFDRVETNLHGAIAYDITIKE